jgi:lysophospholipase L1-like esterase
MKNYKYIGLFLLSLSIISCDVNNELDAIPAEEVAQVTLNTNDLDFSKYIAIGASFTAGYTDNGLFKAGQENSFPNILAQKFGTDFNQPLMNDNFGGLILGGNPVIHPVTGNRLFSERLVFGGSGPVSLQSLNPAAMSTTDFALNNPTGPFNNVGVPGAKSFHLIAPGFGNLSNFPAAANPYAIRLTGGNSNKSILELAVEQSPTFFTLSEVGGNDVLGYATSGGDGSDAITDIATFNYALNLLVNSLTENGAKGAIGNLPDITSLSFFTTVAYNAVPLTEPNVTALNTGYGAYNLGIQQAFAYLVAYTPMTQELADAEIAKRTITFTVGQNAVVIMDENLTDLTALNPGLINMRQATADDLILLTAASLLPNGGGTQTPLSDTYVLLPEEQMAIADATTAYNASIASIASSKGLALVDLNSVLNEATTSGITFDNYVLNTSLVTGGLVSLDGVHLTSRGYAYMANSFLIAIDATYGTNFTKATNGLAKAEDYPTNYSPLLQ